MKRLLILATIAGLVSGQSAMAGNDTKRGQAGATELLINPWSRSTGWNAANSGGIRGVESMLVNIAGLSYLNKVDIAASTQFYMSGAGIQVNALGLGARVSDNGVLGVSFQSISLGDFQQTTVNQPDGTGFNFSPTLFNLGLGYSQKFSNSISGGIMVRTTYQSIPNASALGVSIDAGIQYATGDQERFKFGIALRNVGPKMRYSGEGLGFRTDRDFISYTAQSKVAPFEMPALLSIGAGYDVVKQTDHRLTAAATFVSNSYTRDLFQPGIEYAWREMFMLRSGYQIYQDFAQVGGDATDVHTGLAAGASFLLPLSKKNDGDVALDITDGAQAKADKNSAVLSIDYSFRATSIYKGTHSVGLTLNL